MIEREKSISSKSLGKKKICDWKNSISNEERNLFLGVRFV
jgi:hypothetical protein